MESMMKLLDEFLLIIFLVRHGDTEYTEIFPDLTPQGKEEAKKTGLFIKNQMVPGMDCSFFSSIYPRANGTAHKIAEVVGYNGFINPEILLRRVEFYHEDSQAKFDAAAEKFRKEYEAKVPFPIDHFMLAYSLDPVFSDPKYFEPRLQVRRRCYQFLSRIIQESVTGKRSDKYIIGVTHFELLYKLVQVLFSLDYTKDKTYCTAEPTVLRVSKLIQGNQVLLQVEYRGMIIDDVVFDFKEAAFPLYKEL